MYQCYFTTLAESAFATVGKRVATSCAGRAQPFSQSESAQPMARPDSAQPSMWPSSAQSSVCPDTARRVAQDLPVEARDFDFLHGQWLVENRRVAEPLGTASASGSFDSVHSCRPLASGGHLEEMTSEDGGASATLRLFDARSRRWAIYRVCPAQGTLATPLSGEFASGVGTFIGEETVHGRTVLVRETWTRDAGKPRCERAFSTDGGRTWSTRWIREYIRVDWPQ